MTIINSNQLTIDTVVPAINLGEIMVSADRRSTKEKPLTDAERIRRIVIPAGHWQEITVSLNGAKSQALLDLTRSALTSIASARLRDTLAETADGARTVDLKDYSVDALLTWNAESASSRGSITFTREQVLEWFDGSATADAVLAKHGAVKGAAIIAFLTKRFGALAAKNHGLKDESEALKLAALIAEPDSTGPRAALTAELLQRLDHIAKTLRQRADESTISMDDL